MAGLSDKYIFEFNNNNKSGKMCSEKYVFKNFPNDYDLIIKYTSHLNLSFKQCVYHTIKEIDHIVICKNPKCENIVNFRNSTLGYYDYCSNECVGTDPDIINKKIQKSLQKFGTKTPAESDVVKNKMIETNNIRYGGNSPMSSSEIRNKSIKTLRENYGVDNPNYSTELLNRRIESFKKSNYKETFKKTSLERYGVEHPWMNKDIHQKSVVSSIDKKIETAIHIAESRIPSNYKLIDAYSKSFGRIIYDINCSNCGNNFEISADNLYDRTIRGKTEICTHCNPFDKKSGQEIQLFNYIKSIYSGEILINDRNIISPYELDIYLPELKLGFEFNGLFWHSELKRDISYHSDKTNLCSQKNIKLIHIWEDDWAFKNDIIKSIISYSIGVVQNKIYARQCHIKEIDSKSSKDFLNENHIQGYAPSSIKLGLYYKNELVSLMTFGKLRIILNQENDDDSYELIRFVNKLGFNVIGGASKLFTFFLRSFSPKNITSYSDNSIFSGDLYKKLNFSHLSDTGLDYYWVIDKKRKHRYNFRKSNLVKMGYDKNKTEREIMYEDVGAFRIWGCGMKKWIYTI